MHAACNSSDIKARAVYCPPCPRPGVLDVQTEFWPRVQLPIDLTAYLSDRPPSVPASRNVPQPAPQVAAPWAGAHDGSDVIPFKLIEHWCHTIAWAHCCKVWLQYFVLATLLILRLSLFFKCMYSLSSSLFCCCNCPKP